MESLTPVLFVESIEEALPFWVDRLGFETLFKVPVDPESNDPNQPIGFAMLAHGMVQLMLQSRSSVELDAPGLLRGDLRANAVSFFIEVEDLAPILEAVDGCEIVIPERKTFYGKHEIGVLAPGGFTVLFAAQIEG